MAETILLIAVGIFLTLQVAALVVFAWTFYSAVTVLREFNKSISDLAFQVNGLPFNLRGLPLGIELLGRGIDNHVVQVRALVAVIEKNIGIGGQPSDAKPDPFNPTAQQWDGALPPASPFDQQEE